MSRLLKLVLIFLTLSLQLHAQEKEGAIWYFGSQSGVSFESGMLAPDNGNQFNNNNITSTIADSLGNLLFYTNGTQLLNRNHEVMPNGNNLNGARVSTIFKRPESANAFYVIGITETGEMWITLVDMALDNGLGDVIDGAKNLVLFPTGIAPKLSLTLHSNGVDVWIITHEMASNRYISVLATNGGLSSPTRVAIGRTYCDRTNNNCGTLGMMKSSPNGALIADPLPLFSEVQVVSFDNTSGFFRSIITLETELTLIGEKRAAGFSPNSRYLYEGSGQVIAQYDLNAGDEASVRSSKLLLQNVTGGVLSNFVLDFQLSIDGRLYFLVSGSSNQLGVINCPNVRGGNSDIQAGKLSFSTSVGNIDGFAPQPNFFFQNTALRLNASASNICLGDTVQIAAFGGGIENFSWAPANTLIEANTLLPKAIPTETTTYTITGSDLCGNTYSRSITIEVAAVEGLIANSNSPVKSGEQIRLEASGVILPNVTYEWFGPNNFSSTEQNPLIDNATFENAGAYQVVATSAEGCKSDTVETEVKVIGEIIIEKIADVKTQTIEALFCPEQALILTYKILPSLPFEGTLQLSDENGDFTTPTDLNTATFNQESASEGMISFSLPPKIPLGEAYKIRILPTKDSLYTIINDLSFEISLLTTQVAADTTLCNPTTYALNANPFNLNETGYWEVVKGTANFLGDSTQTNVRIDNLANGENLLVWHLKRGSCTATDTLKIEVNLAKAALNFSRDTTICQGDSLLLKINTFDNSGIQWYRDNAAIENAQSTSLQVDSSGVYYAIASVNGSCTDTSATIKIIVLPNPSVAIPLPDTLKICFGESTEFLADTLNAQSIQWQFNNKNIENATSLSLTASQEGEYRAFVNNELCSDTSRIIYLKTEAIQVPRINAGDTLLFCNSSAARLQADTVQGYQYQWQRNKIDILNAKNPLLETTLEGEYRLVINSTSCSDTSRNIVLQSIPPVVLSYPDSISVCANNTYSPPLLLQDSLLTFLWNTEVGINNQQIENPTFSLEVLQDTTIKYVVTVLNIETKCVAFDTLNVAFFAKPTVNAGGDILALCEGDSIKIGTPLLPNLKYEWNRASFLSDSTLAEPTFSSVGITDFFQTYILKVTDTITQCTAFDTVNINVIPKVELTLENSYTVCSEDTITLASVAQLGVKYKWITTNPDLRFPNTETIQFTMLNNGSAPDTLLLILEAQAETCFGFDTTRVIVLPKPKIGALTGNTSICTNELSQIYTIQNENKLTIRWEVTGGNILSENDSSISISWENNEVSKKVEATPVSPLRCNYAPQSLNVLLRNPPKPLIANFSAEICETESVQTYQIANPAVTSSYRWQVAEGEILSGQNTTSVSINWQQNLGTFWVVETAENGCIASSDTVEIVVNKTPSISSAQTEINLCATNLLNQSYSIEKDSSSLVSWMVTGGTVVSGANAKTVTINWENATEKSLKVVAQSEKGCISDSLFFNINSEKINLIIKRISVENNGILIETAPLSQPTQLQRSNDGISWTDVAQLNANTTQFTDNTVDTDSQSFFYRLTVLNTCNDVVFSSIHKSIYLQGEAFRENNSIDLNWSPYQGWEEHLLGYQIFQIAGDEAVLIEQVNPNQTEYTVTPIPFAAKVCYFIKAVQDNAPSESDANLLCFTFSTELVIPNVFTPNNDRHNDSWEIINVPPNTDFKVKVVNRWGQSVFESADPNKSWDGKDIPEGIYFYQLKLNEEIFKGWIKILR